MKTMVEKMKVYFIGFDFKIMSYVDGVKEIEKDDKNGNLKDYYRIIDCDLIDIVNYSEEIAIVVDDEGLLKSGNPVFEINLPNGNQLHLAGTLVFAKDPKNGESLTGLDAGEIYNLMMNLDIKVIGVTG